MTASRQQESTTGTPAPVRRDERRDARGEPRDGRRDDPRDEPHDERGGEPVSVDAGSERELLQVPATIDAVPRVVDFVSRLATSAGLHRRQGRRLRLAAEEIVVNVARHASPPDRPAWITLDGGVEQGAVWLRITDTAPPFDPTAPPAGGPPQSVGGVGLILVRNMVDRICYRRVGDRNETTLLLHAGSR